MNYYPFNVGDYAAHTAHLEPMEDLAYRRLLDAYYLRESPLPADIQATAKLIRMRSMAADVECVLREFFTLTDEGWRHSRCDYEIERMKDKQAKARASAQHSVNARRANAQRMQADVERSLPSEPADVELPTPTPTPTPSKKRNTGADALTVESLVVDGLTEQTANEFIAHRKAKGAKLTARAWQGFKAEAGKAGWPVEQAVCKALARGWTGFEAAWVASESRPNGARVEVEPAWRTEQRERVAQFAGPAAAKRPATTTGEVFDVTARLVG